MTGEAPKPNSPEPSPPDSDAPDPGPPGPRPTEANQAEPNPAEPNPAELTQLLNLTAGGDEDAARKIVPLLYGELRRIAAHKRRQKARGDSLTSSVLVHEAYLRVFDREPDGWQARSHFFFAAARAMHDILVEDSRRRAAVRHGGGLRRVDLEDVGVAIEADPDEVLALDRCLERLEAEDSVGHQIVMLRFFVGLANPEIAEVLGVSSRTVERKWSFLRAWLAAELTHS
ncbi:MAG: ECF-type sigma factor [Candidatus Eisenbacteria bacterium]